MFKNFDESDLNGTNLSFSILVGCRSFEKAKNISEATYEGTIIDEKLYRDFFKNTKLKGAPYIIKKEQDLRDKLQ